MSDLGRYLVRRLVGVLVLVVAVAVAVPLALCELCGTVGRGKRRGED